MDHVVIIGVKENTQKENIPIRPQKKETLFHGWTDFLSRVGLFGRVFFLIFFFFLVAKMTPLKTQTFPK